MNTSIFKQIIDGHLPCYKVAENDSCLAFLDIYPIKFGHTIVISKNVTTDYLFDIDDNHLIDLQLFAKKVAISIKKAITCKRVGVMVAGFEVNHAHIHLIPINNSQDLNFNSSQIKLTDREFTTLSEKILNIFNN